MMYEYPAVIKKFEHQTLITKEPNKLMSILGKLLQVINNIYNFYILNIEIKMF